MTPQQRDKSMENANNSAHYIWILVGTAVAILGVFLRFAFDNVTWSIISWAILFIGSFIACKGVFKIMSDK